MTKPTTSLAKQLEEERLANEETFLQTDRDFSFKDGLVVERQELIGGVIHVIPVSTERNPVQGIGPFQTAGVDDLYGDILDPQFTDGNPEDQRKLNCRGYIQHEPSKQLLTLYGIDEQREIAFYIARTTLTEVGLVSEWRFHGTDIGDLFVWDGTWYQAQNVHRAKYFGQRDLAHYTASFCNRFRHNAVPTNAVADPCPEEA